MAGAVAVEEVAGRKAMARFVELPQALYGGDPRWAPPVMAWERYRLDPHRNPYFERGDGAYLLARKLGRPAGRIAAHVPWPGGEGRFGFFTSVDDIDVTRALVDAARSWLAEQGCSSMTGPYSFEPDDEPGVLADGFDVPGTTGRPWRPPWDAGLLGELGFHVVEQERWWRLPTSAAPKHDDDPPLTDGSAAAPSGALASEGVSDDIIDDLPGQAGPYADRRLVLPGIVAVPDVAGALRQSSLRTAWRLAKRARAGDWDTCTVVRWTAELGDEVPLLQAAAGSAGYHHVVAPWAPEPAAPPLAAHETLRLTW